METLRRTTALFRVTTADYGAVWYHYGALRRCLESLRWTTALFGITTAHYGAVWNHYGALRLDCRAPFVIATIHVIYSTGTVPVTLTLTVITLTYSDYIVYIYLSICTHLYLHLTYPSTYIHTSITTALRKSYWRTLPIDTSVLHLWTRLKDTKLTRRVDCRVNFAT